jgi:hypothetical protein
MMTGAQKRAGLNPFLYEKDDRHQHAAYSWVLFDPSVIDLGGNANALRWGRAAGLRSGPARLRAT